MLISTLLRAKELASRGIDLFASPALKFFLYNDISREAFYNNPECLENFIQLDDNDIWTALKVWSRHSDKVLSTLSAGMINRNIFKVEISTEPISEERKKELTLQISEQLNIPLSEARYFISTPSIEKNMYDEADDSIDILYNDGSIKNIAEASDMLNISLLSKKVKKYYLCYQRLRTFPRAESADPCAKCPSPAEEANPPVYTRPLFCHPADIKTGLRSPSASRSDAPR